MERETGTTYRLADGVRIFRTGEEIRLRKGVWNHQEATLRLTGQPQPVKDFLHAVHEALARNGEVDAAAIGASLGATPEATTRYRALLDELKQQQFLLDSAQRDAVRHVGALLGGTLGFEEQVGTPRPVLFFADTEYARAAARALARELSLPLDVMDEDVAQGLATADLTSRLDAVDHVAAVARHERIFTPYCCVVGCMSSPNLSFLRNLNRLMVRASKPLIAGLVDGPFVIALSTLATDTGCFECFEQRALVRLQDMAVYQQFVKATAGPAPRGAAFVAPQVQMLTSAVLSEAYLYATIGMMRLAGRIVNVYLPQLEIQVQDLLRVPYCPACGYVSRAQMDEMYTSTGRLVADMLKKTRIEG